MTNLNDGPHVASDNAAIEAAHTEIWSNAIERFDFAAAVVKARPTMWFIDQLRNAAMSLHHEYMARMERETKS